MKIVCRVTNCSLGDNESSFLWCLLDLYFMKHSLNEANEFVSSMYEQKFKFTDKFEVLLLKFWETNDVKYIIEIAKKMLYLSMLDIEKHILLVAVLVASKEISVAEAAIFLRRDISEEYSNLDPKTKRVIDVAWLINEDTKDKIMAPGDDNILLEALREVSPKN